MHIVSVMDTSVSNSLMYRKVILQVKEVKLLAAVIANQVLCQTMLAPFIHKTEVLYLYNVELPAKHNFKNPT